MPDQAPINRSESDWLAKNAITLAPVDIYRFVTGEPVAAAIDLTELKIWPPRQGERRAIFPIWVDLRVADQMITTEKWHVIVHLTALEVVAKFEGCDIAQGSRYGDRVLGEGASVSKIDGQITSLPNNRWEVNGREKRLRGAYLVAPEADVSAEQPLCKVSGTSDSPKITLMLQTRPNYIDTEFKPIERTRWQLLKIRWPWARKERLNKSAIAKLLVREACTQRFSELGDDRITLAHAVLQGTRITEGAPQ